MSETVHVSAPGTRWTVPDPSELALRIRRRAVWMVAPHGFGYLGQALSSAEQVAAVFASARPGLDRLVCSPGHYIIGPFAAAAELGLLDDGAVARYGQDGSPVEAIGTERSPVVDYTCGSLGQGLSAALGFALADRFVAPTRGSSPWSATGNWKRGRSGRPACRRPSSSRPADRAARRQQLPGRRSGSTASPPSSRSPRSGRRSAGTRRTSTVTTWTRVPRGTRPGPPRRGPPSG